MANIGTFDRLLRLIVGILIIVAPFVPASAAYFAPWGVWRFALVVVGIVSLATAVFRFCPAYAMFGVGTCRLGQR